eukprot:TRINITY_DN3126_c0_g1_i3.p1 TRINITY_DN3126_c0_g1~~TRINITY_DN3126_c0_g1_i3.p1  ORF type:complete len:296 (+),score=52.38 TRINITY_DN3126_c0_g1_i3:251-1138(+)
MALLMPMKAEYSGQRKTVEYLNTNRPWLSLYGARVRPVPGFGSLCNSDQSLIHRMLPDELLYEVFACMPPYTLGRAACVCRKWRYAIRNPSLWRNACVSAWQLSGPEENFKILKLEYGGSWYKMWLHRPRLRFDGVYVGRNTYIRSGTAEWETTNPVHLVCYYRYLRFFPSGRCLYKISPQRVKEVAKLMQGKFAKRDAIFTGCFTILKDMVKVAILYPGSRPTVSRIKLSVNENGGNVEENGLAFGWIEDENNNHDPPTLYRRGLAPFVFVPFEEADTSDLNLSVDKMDYFVPG